MLSICTVNVISVSYPILISEIYEIGFLDLFFWTFFSARVPHFSLFTEMPWRIVGKISLPHESCVVTNIR